MIPDWFNQTIEKQTLEKNEEEELKDLLSNYS